MANSKPRKQNNHTLDRCIPTLNHKGFQMSTTSPLFEDWIESYDGKHPLLDVGCAYGINTFAALHQDIPVIALDMDREHLKKVEQNQPTAKSHLLSCVFGKLPDDIPIPDSSVSGILLAECAHFLDEKEITPALTLLFEKLSPNGCLCITTMSIHYLDGIDDPAVSQFYEKKTKGMKWPGVLHFNTNYWLKLTNSANCLREVSDIWAAKPSFANFTDINELKEELVRIGFEIVSAEECQHLGYPAAVRENHRANIQIIARKPQLFSFWSNIWMSK